MGSGEDARDTEIRYLHKINENQSDQINWLAAQVQELQLQNRLLIEAVLRKNPKPTIIPEDIPEPVGGYVPLRDRIKEAEDKSREEALKTEETKDAS